MTKLALLLLGSLPLLGGCAPPTQYGGPIPIDQAGLGHRLAVLCRLEAGDEAARAACAPRASLPVAGDRRAPLAQSPAAPPPDRPR